MPRKTKSKKTTAVLPVLHPDAAGVDIGATEIYVAVPPDRDPESVRSFQTFTEDLMAEIRRSGKDGIGSGCGSESMFCMTLGRSLDV